MSAPTGASFRSVSALSPAGLRGPRRRLRPERVGVPSLSLVCAASAGGGVCLSTAAFDVSPPSAAALLSGCALSPAPAAPLPRRFRRPPRRPRRRRLPEDLFSPDAESLSCGGADCDVCAVCAAVSVLLSTRAAGSFGLPAGTSALGGRSFRSAGFAADASRGGRGLRSRLPRSAFEPRAPRRRFCWFLVPDRFWLRD